jgi:hypothetical protein
LLPLEALSTTAIRGAVGAGSVAGDACSNNQSLAWERATPVIAFVVLRLERIEPG